MPYGVTEVNMSSSYNYDDILKIKHSFLTNEKRTYFLELLKNAKERNIHFLLKDIDSELLFEKATELMDLTENGELNQQEMQVAEYKILHFLSAIDEVKQDKTLYVAKYTLENQKLLKQRHISRLKVAETLMERSNQVKNQDKAQEELE